MSETQPADPEDRLREGDRGLIEPFGHEVTVNEVHALVLGTAGFLVATTVDPLDSLLTVAFVAYAVGGTPTFASLPHTDPEYDKSIGLKTIKHEPWYFLGSYLPSYVVGYWLF